MPIYAPGLSPKPFALIYISPRPVKSVPHEGNLDPMTAPMASRTRIGVSACLTGEKVRYDGNDKRDSYIATTLSHYFDLVPICPETGIGLGVPREPIHLEGDARNPRAVGLTNKSLDVTEALVSYGRKTAEGIGAISGYIFKSKSPSCGLHLLINDEHNRTSKGRGVFSRELILAMPLLPAVEEGCLADAEARDNFLERIFAYRRWQDLESQGITPAILQEFHAVHKLILMAHSPEAYRALGRLVAHFDVPISTLANTYMETFMGALMKRATKHKHANVMHHLMGYLKNSLRAGEKAELSEMIEQYCAGDQPLGAPLKLLRHHFERHPNTYVARQLYLYSSTEERELRGL
jgi:uncharacterized protein YbgA (DUF1722 family)/uncharacterized protein YbbK (DUF523 family)